MMINKDNINPSHTISEARKEYSRKWNRENKWRYREKARKYNKEYVIRRFGSTTGEARFRRYGMTPVQFDEMYERQNGICLICNNAISKKSKDGEKMLVAHVDHNHSTGRIRGILCCNCNRGLGYFKDNITTMLRAIEYIRKDVNHGL